MDIDLLSESTEQTSLSFSSNLLQYSPSRLITPDTPGLFDQNLSHQSVLPAFEARHDGCITDQGGPVISKLATISASIAECIIGGKEELEIQIKSRAKQKTMSGLDSEMDSRKENRPHRTRFPSKCPTEVRRFGE